METKKLIKLLIVVIAFTVIIGIVSSIKSKANEKRWLFYITVENKCNVNKAYFYNKTVTVRNDKKVIRNNTLNSISMQEIENYVKKYENNSDEVYKIVFKDESVYYVDINDEYINYVFTILNYSNIFDCE